MDKRLAWIYFADDVVVIKFGFILKYCPSPLQRRGIRGWGLYSAAPSFSAGRRI